MMAFRTEHVLTQTTIRTYDNNILELYYYIILFSKDPPFRSRGNYSSFVRIFCSLRDHDVIALDTK